MRISSPVVISSDDDETPRKGAWDAWGAGADLVFVPSDDEPGAESGDDGPISVPSSHGAISVHSSLSAISVASSDDAISVSTSTDDDEDIWDSWGADAVLHYVADSDSAASAARVPSPASSASPLPARPARPDPAPGPSRPEMPDYASWTLPRLKVS